jgi:uncharacterized membrane protein YccC
MASRNPPLPQAEVLAFRQPPSFWTSEAASLKQGIKTGLAGAITYAVYAGWHLNQGYWAVFAALVVTQANVGASWKAALYRTIGSTAGALAAALLLPMLGSGTIGVGIMLFLLASFFGYLTALHSAFTAAGVTAAIILVFGGISEPWHTAWLRVLYTTEGAFVAFGVGALIWPVRAREGLRQKIATIIEGAGTLYQAITAAALQGVNNEQEIREFDRQLHDLRRGITQQMDEARSELSFSRFKAAAFQRLVEGADLIRRRLTAMAEDRFLYVHAQAEPGLVPSLPVLAEKTVQMFRAIAEAIRTSGTVVDNAELDAALQSLDAELARLRTRRATAPFALDRMLPFWALVFNLREIAEEMKQLPAILSSLLQENGKT